MDQRFLLRAGFILCFCSVSAGCEDTATEHTAAEYAKGAQALTELQFGERDPTPELELADIGEGLGTIEVAVSSVVDVERAGILWRAASERNSSSGVVELVRIGPNSFHGRLELQKLGLDLSPHLGSGSVVLTGCLYSERGTCNTTEGRLAFWFTAGERGEVATGTGSAPLVSTAAGAELAERAGLASDEGATLNVRVRKLSSSTNWKPVPEGDSHEEH